jgi:hypothetical protein
MLGGAEMMSRANVTSIHNNVNVTPHSEKAEQTVLGALLLNKAIPLSLDELLTVSDFYLEPHQAIFAAMRELDQNVGRFDIVSVAEKLKSDNAFEKSVGYGYLSELEDCVGTVQGLDHHAGIIQEKADLRRMIETAQKIELLANSQGANASTVLERAYELLSSIERQAVCSSISADQLLSAEFSSSVPVIGDGILPDGGGMLIAGESGVGKSLARTELAICLSHGKSIWGLPVCKAWRVLVLQFENTLTAEQTRLSKMIDGMGLQGPPPGLIFSDPKIRLNLEMPNHRSKALKLIRESKAEVVIYDPLSSLHECDENSNSEMRSILDSITEINRNAGTTAIVIHHFGKPQKDQPNDYRFRGASSIRDWADTLVSLTPKNSKNKTLLQLEFHKVRNGPRPKPILLERNECFLHHPIGSDELCPPSLVAELLGELGGEVESQKELKKIVMDRTGCADRSAADFIREAVKAKAIREHKSGKAKAYLCV